jgi:hypothetical protein
MKVLKFAYQLGRGVAEEVISAFCTCVSISCLIGHFASYVIGYGLIVFVPVLGVAVIGSDMLLTFLHIFD